MTLVLSVLLAVMGVLLCIAGTKEDGRWYFFILAALIFLIAFGLGRRQTAGNAGKNAALFAMLECARTYRHQPVAFCFLEETRDGAGAAAAARALPAGPIGLFESARSGKSAVRHFKREGSEAL